MGKALVSGIFALFAAAAFAAPAYSANKGDAKDAQQDVQRAIQVVQRMRSDPNVKKLLEQSKGVFVVPQYGKGGLIVGGSGGTGVLIAHHDGSWSNPAFYNMGSISIGAQAGGAGGEIAMILMSDKAVNSFKNENNFSLNANAGFSIVDYSKGGQASWGRADIVLWTNTKGAYGGATVSASDVNFDEDETHAYYGTKVEPEAILTGKVAQAPESAQKLKSALKS